jgi:excisionase family DNA binding protein
MTTRKALFTVKEAAVYLRCGVSTLNKLRVTGGGPRYVKIGGKILYDQRDLDKWIEDHKRNSTSDQPTRVQAA